MWYKSTQDKSDYSDPITQCRAKKERRPLVEKETQHTPFSSFHHGHHLLRISRPSFNLIILFNWSPVQNTNGVSPEKLWPTFWNKSCAAFLMSGLVCYKRVQNVQVWLQANTTRYNQWLKAFILLSSFLWQAFRNIFSSINTERVSIKTDLFSQTSKFSRTSKSF